MCIDCFYINCVAKSLFLSNSTQNVEIFYINCINLIETTANEFEMNRMNYDYVEDETNDYNQKLMYLVLSLLINHYLLNLLLDSNHFNYQNAITLYSK